MSLGPAAVSLRETPRDSHSTTVSISRNCEISPSFGRANTAVLGLVKRYDIREGAGQRCVKT